MDKRDAFARAVRDMAKAHLVRPIKNGDSDRYVRFQLTNEFHEGDGLGYDRAAVLTLDLEDGSIQCNDNPDLGRFAETAIKEAAETRTGTDIVAIAHRLLMKSDIDLFPIRWKGGAYFVADRHRGFVDKIDHFFKSLACKMHRWPIAKSEPGSSGAETVADAVCRGIAEQVDGLKESIKKLHVDSRPSSFERIAVEIKEKRFKARSYADLLGTLQEEVMGNIQECDDELERIVSVIVAGGDPHEGEESPADGTDEEADDESEYDDETETDGNGEEEGQEAEAEELVEE